MALIHVGFYVEHDGPWADLEQTVLDLLEIASLNYNTVTFSGKEQQ